jgi:acyl-CoA thioesterase I
MSIPGAHLWLTIIISLVVATGIIAATNYALIRHTGTPVPIPDIPRTAETFGTGTPLVYAVLGDSTTVSQGSGYDEGYARGSARVVADKGNRVQLTNYGVSGARARDISAQAENAAASRPDLVLIAVGANDVTHLTPIRDIEQGITRAVDTLRTSNPDARIVITGSPQMGSIPRFPQPASYLARLRTAQVNRMALRLAGDKQLIFAPIADKTGEAFDRHPEYYAADKFHPNAVGYALWTPVISHAVADALDSR